MRDVWVLFGLLVLGAELGRACAERARHEELMRRLLQLERPPVFEVSVVPTAPHAMLIRP